MTTHYRISLFLLLTIVVSGCSVWLSSCDNPFAPRLASSNIQIEGLGDQRTIDGLFKNFRYAYQTKDTTIYGKLLAPNFAFIYRNYDKNIDITFGRDEDILSTLGLFSASQNIDVIFNDVIQAVGDSVIQDISRGFNLTITFSPQDIVRVQGRMNLRIVRASSTEVWKIATWRDESNY